LGDFIVLRGVSRLAVNLQTFSFSLDQPVTSTAISTAGTAMASSTTQGKDRKAISSYGKEIVLCRSMCGEEMPSDYSAGSAVGLHTLASLGSMDRASSDETVASATI
jgi:hypothetical protein